jgi:hypothetical protein
MRSVGLGMPTSSSIFTARSRAARRLTLRWMRIASMICAPTE